MPITIGETEQGRLLPARVNEQGETIVAGMDAHLVELGNILASLGLVATETTAVQIRDAVGDLGDGATISDLAAALNALLGSVATEATLAVIQVELETLNITSASAASTLEGINAGVDEVEPKLDMTVAELQAIRDRLPAALIEGRLVVLAKLVPDILSSFGEVKVTMREPLFKNVQRYELDLRQWAVRAEGGGAVTFNTTSGVTEISVGGASGDLREISTHTHWPYEPGATSSALITMSMSDAGQPGQVREVAFGTPDDAYLWRLDGTALSIVRRASSSGTPTDHNVIPQASWNVEPYPTLDLTKINQWLIDFQWLSAGLIQFWLNGRRVHVLDLRGEITLPSTRFGQLPIRLTIQNTGPSAPAALGYVCSTVFLAGGTDLRFVPGTYARSAAKTGITTDLTPIIAFRMAQTYLSQANRKIVLSQWAEIANENGAGIVQLVFNPTAIAGGTWAAVPTAPWLEYNEGLTGITGGTKLTERYLPNSADSRRLDARGSFHIDGIHLRRTADNTGGDSIVLMGAADAGQFDIRSVVSVFHTLG